MSQAEQPPTDLVILFVLGDRSIELKCVYTDSTVNVESFTAQCR